MTWLIFTLLMTGAVHSADPTPPTVKPISKTLNALKIWLAQSADKRTDLTKLAFAKTALTRDEAAQARQWLWQAKKDALKKNRADEWEAKKITLGKETMRFAVRTFGDAPASGRSLYLSLHGGGGAPARLNDAQWQNQIRLYKTPPGSLYIAPRAPTNAWDLWHKAHIDAFFQRLIEDAVVLENVDPNRVYVMGYSAGGDGVYQLAPRMADRWAAAAMMAGHPNDASPLGLRNIGFTLWCGANDAAYKRNKVAAQWGERLAALKKADPKGYRHEVHIQKGMGHWMNRTDAAAIGWMAEFTRNPFPDKIVWKQDNVTHERFYWLAVPGGKAKPGAQVTATRKGQTVTIEKAEKAATLCILLNDDICNLDRPVKVIWGSRTVFRGRISRTMAVIWQSLKARADPASVFTGQIQVDQPAPH